MAKSIVIVTEAVAVGEFYRQLLNDLFGSAIHILNFCTDRDTLVSLPDADLYMVGATSSNIFGHVISLIRSEKSIVVVTLTFQKSQIGQLRDIPRGTQAMLMNLSVNMAIETIAELNRLGVTQIDLLPGYPNMREIPDTDLVITPGEARFVPAGARQVLDIGNRVFTSQTLTEAALKLGYNWFLKSEQYRAYVDSLMEPEESVAMLWKESLRMEKYLDILMGALDIGILGVDTQDKIFAMNSIAQAITGVSREMVGSALSEAIPELGKVIEQEGNEEKISKLLKLNDSYITMSTAPVVWQGEPVGCFVLLQRFTEEEKRQHQFRLQLYQRGYKSKYIFSDIVGQCPSIVRTKSIARKMARTDSSILLTGESGTGKELFAHSIHHASQRGDMPFVAVNCAALPEPLLESELFGYAEGAFTGAKKGGKLGLFEYAHKGTLFLDEIEGMSPNLQIKLLRVLQEQEVMRVGDDRIISIDVRIIAASNENILEMVHKGSFRRDLYYRLNTLPINILPLRERGDDLFLIMAAIQEKLGARFTLSAEARGVFRAFAWDGNVRELSNIVEYLRFADKAMIEVEDLPKIMTAGAEQTMYRAFRAAPPPQADRRDEVSAFQRAAQGREEAFAFVLRALGEASGGVGRCAICRSAREQGVPLTEQEVRGILSVLNGLGLASVSRGRGGSRLTREGMAFLKTLQNG